MPENIKEQAPWWQPGLILFFKLTRWIAVPLVVSFLLGRFLDQKFGTDPWIFFGGLSLGFIVSCFGLVHEARIEVDRMQSAEKAISKDNDLKN